MCYEIAKKHNTKIDFKKKNQNAYYAAYRNGWLNDICSHMINRKGNYKWSKEKCHELALKYHERNVFRKNHPNAYYSAMHNGWLNDICSHMKYRKLPNRHWHDFENCKNEALKYKTKTDFIENSQHVYNISLKNGWLGDICKHMIPIGDRYNKCIYVYEFIDNHAYVGLTYDLNIRIKNRKRDKKDAVVLHIKKTGLTPKLIQLTDYISVDLAIEMEYEYLEQYKSNGWKMLNKRKTGGIGSSTPVWNYNRVKSIATKYKCSDEFKTNEYDMYSIAKRSGWIDSFFSS